MCYLVDAEGKGERGGFYLRRPLPETMIQVDVSVPGHDSVQESSESGKMCQTARDGSCRGSFFQTGQNEAR